MRIICHLWAISASRVSLSTLPIASLRLKWQLLLKILYQTKKFKRMGVKSWKSALSSENDRIYRLLMYKTWELLAAAQKAHLVCRAISSLLRTRLSAYWPANSQLWSPTKIVLTILIRLPMLIMLTMLTMSPLTMLKMLQIVPKKMVHSKF